MRIIKMLVCCLIGLILVGCNNFKPNFSVPMTYDEALEIYFDKNASDSDVQIAEESLRKNLAQEGYKLEEINLSELEELKKEGYTALMLASAMGLSVTVKKYIANGANPNDVNNNGEIALMLVGVTDESRKHKTVYSEIVKTLVAAGANVNAKDKSGATALFSASIDGNTEVVKALISAGADVNIKAKNEVTILMVASGWNGNREIVKALIDAGAEVNASDSRGQTALIYAAIAGNAETAKELIASGANIYMARQDGKIALTLAEEKCKNEVAKILREQENMGVSIVYN